MSNQGVEKRKKRSKLLNTEFFYLEFRVRARRGDFFRVIKSSKDPTKRGKQAFYCPTGDFYYSSVLCFDLSFANSIHSLRNNKTDR